MRMEIFCFSFSLTMSRRDEIGCKVYVGDLPKDAAEKELERAFDYYGPLKKVWVARNPPGNYHPPIVMMEQYQFIAQLVMLFFCRIRLHRVRGPAWRGWRSAKFGRNEHLWSARARRALQRKSPTQAVAQEYVLLGLTILYEENKINVIVAFCVLQTKAEDAVSIRTTVASSATNVVTTRTTAATVAVATDVALVRVRTIVVVARAATRRVARARPTAVAAARDRDRPTGGPDRVTTRRTAVSNSMTSRAMPESRTRKKCILDS